MLANSYKREGLYHPFDIIEALAYDFIGVVIQSSNDNGSRYDP